jgi:hypothetical protein
MDTLEAVVTNPQNQWVLGSFALFLALSLVFAHLYQRLYESNEDNFFFPRDALFEQRRQSQRDQLLESRALIDSRLQSVTALIDYVKTYPDGLTRRADGLHAELPDGRQYRFQCYENPNLSQTDVYITTKLTVFDCLGNILHSIWLDRGGFAIPREADEFCSAISQHCDEWHDEQSSIDARLDMVERGKVLWFFSDFFYFSFMTQTTLGSNDIVAASRDVRRLVFIQVFLAFIILVVLVNVVVFSA